MARRQQPKYRIQAYDGDYKSRDLLPGYAGGHRIQEKFDNKADVLARADAWMAAHPPQAVRARSQTEPFVEIVDRNGDRVALWQPENGAWVERYNHLRGRKRNAAVQKYYVIGILQQDDNWTHVNEVVESIPDRVVETALGVGAQKVGKEWRDWELDPKRDGYNYWLLAIVEISPGLPVVYSGSQHYTLDAVTESLEDEADKSLPLWVGAGQDYDGETYVFRFHASSQQDYADELDAFARRVDSEFFDPPYGLVREDGGGSYTVIGPRGKEHRVSTYTWGIPRRANAGLRQLKRSLLRP